MSYVEYKCPDQRPHIIHYWFHPTQGYQVLCPGHYHYIPARDPHRSR